MDEGRPPPFGGAVVLLKPRRLRHYSFDGGNAAASSLRDLAICEAPIVDHVLNKVHAEMPGGSSPFVGVVRCCRERLLCASDDGEVAGSTDNLEDSMPCGH